MKAKTFAAMMAVAVAAALAGTGCVNTVSGQKTAGVPFLKDKAPAKYEKPLDQVFAAALDVIKANGVLVSEGTLHEDPGQTNTPAGPIRTIEGRVNQRSVYMRIWQQEPPVTDVLIQTRTSGGGTDIDLAYQLDKQLALRLAR